MEFLMCLLIIVVAYNLSPIWGICASVLITIHALLE